MSIIKLVGIMRRIPMRRKNVNLREAHQKIRKGVIVKIGRSGILFSIFR
jgi:hypothetical protein